MKIQISISKHQKRKMLFYIRRKHRKRTWLVYMRRKKETHQMKKVDVYSLKTQKNSKRVVYISIKHLKPHWRFITVDNSQEENGWFIHVENAQNESLLFLL